MQDFTFPIVRFRNAVVHPWDECQLGKGHPSNAASGVCLQLNDVQFNKAPREKYVTMDQKKVNLCRLSSIFSDQTSFNIQITRLCIFTHQNPIHPYNTEDMKHISKAFLLAFVVAMAATLASFTIRESGYKIDPQKSKITWVGKKVTGQHNGTINLSEGNFTTKGKKITGGSFTIDMSSLKDADASQRLESHLKSDDFFSTEKFPTSTFVISKIESKGGDQYAVQGKLTIKGITNEIDFPATIQIANNQISAKAKILVDRTKFDIKFRSGNFFENLGDKAIEDIFELNVDLAGAAR
jgi:polyisoprenoid-binding protein YceI